MVYAQIQIFCLLQRARLLRERGDHLLVRICHSKLSVFLFLSLLLTFLFFCFTSFSSQCLLLVMVFPRNSYYCDFFESLNPPLQCIARGPLYRTCRDQYLLFQPLTAFVQCECPYRPLTRHQLFNHHHLFVLAVPLHSARQRRLFCMFACCGFTTHYNVCALSLYPSWHTPSGSNLSLLLLGGMSSQQDISPKKA